MALEKLALEGIVDGYYRGSLFDHLEPLPRLFVARILNDDVVASRPRVVRHLNSHVRGAIPAHVAFPRPVTVIPPVDNHFGTGDTQCSHPNRSASFALVWVDIDGRIPREVVAWILIRYGRRYLIHISNELLVLGTDRGSLIIIIDTQTPNTLVNSIHAFIRPLGGEQVAIANGHYVAPVLVGSPKCRNGKPDLILGVSFERRFDIYGIDRQ